jgi:pimeloyl-ACP methyl ester carboxylesterase
MGGSSFPGDIFLSSERWARKRFPGMVYWNELERGGHFAALEQPELFVQELRNCFAQMR